MGKKKNRWDRKVLSILLSVMLLMTYSSSASFAVFAEGETGEQQTVTEVEKTTDDYPQNEQTDAGDTAAPSDTDDKTVTEADDNDSDSSEKKDTQKEEDKTSDSSVKSDDESKDEVKSESKSDSAEDSDSSDSDSEGELPALKVKYTSPLADDEIDEDTPLRAGIMKKALLSSASVSDGTIKNFLAEIFYGGEEDADGKYVWHAASSAKDHRFSIRYSFTLGSEGEEGVYKGSTDDSDSGVHIVIPATVLKDRNGSPADYFEMSIPSRDDVLESIQSGETLDGDMSFAWYEEAGDIVIYNFRDIEQGFDGFIEMSYLTSEKTFEYIDMQESDVIPVMMTANLDSGSESTVTSETGPIVIDTQVELLNMESRIPSQYSTWQSGWGPAADAGIDTPSDYTYMQYEVRSRINDNSQMYDFTIDEVFPNLVAVADDGTTYTYDEIKDHIKVVGVKFSGDSKLTPDTDGDGSCTAPNQTQNGYRSDYVVVALDKNFWGSKVHWEVTTNTTVTVHPVDGLDDDSTMTYKRKYVYNKPNFDGSGGGVGSYKRADGYYRYAVEKDITTTYWTGLGMNAGYYSRYDLTEFIEAAQAGEEYVLDGLDYAVGTNARPGGWTADPDYVPEGKTPETTEKWEQYYRKPIKLEMIDDQFFLYDEQDSSETHHTDADHKLKAGDYRIDSVAFGFNSYDRAYNPTTAQFDKKVAISYLDGVTIDGMDEPYQEAVDFFAKTGSPDGEWVKVATYNMVTGSYDYVNSDIASTSGRKIVFKNDSDENTVYGYKFETYNVHYYTSIGTVPNVSLLNTDNVMSYITTVDGAEKSKTESIALYNSAVTNIYDYKAAEGSEVPYTHKVSGGKVGNNLTTDADYIRVVQKESALQKNVVATANSPRKKQYSITWEILMSETYTADADGNTKPITQNGGVFYDLLPAGASVDPDTIAVSNESGELRNSNYSYEIKQGYKDGRALLIVKVKEPGDNYTLTYDTIHPYESLRDYGNEIYNPIAYETGNSNIYMGTTNDDPDKKLVGTQDDEGNLDPMTEADLMTNLPSDAQGNKFIYQERLYDIGAITAAASGLSKKVLTDRNGSYAGSGITANNSSYSYRLRYQNSYANQTKDLILFDSLENYKGGGDWQGTLQSVDLSLLTEKGIAPKVYISTKTGLDIEDDANRDLTSDIWKEVDPAEDDLSEAEMVAIDMTKGTDGEDFILDKGDAVAAYLFCEAPAGAEREDGNDGYPEAYNNVYIQTAVYTDTVVGEPVLYNYDYTIVQLVIYGDVNMRKVSPEGDPIRNIKFRLYGTSDYGTDIDQYEISDKSGYLTFKDIEKGSYKLVEYEGTPDWLEDHTEHDVTIDGSGKVKIDGKDYTEEIYEVENDPRVHADFNFIKIRQRTEDSDALIRIEDAKFLLKGESDYGNDVIKDATSDENGVVAFTDVEMGTYTLTEIGTTDEYLLNEEEYKVIVNADAEVSIYVKDESGEFVPVEDAEGTELIPNTPKYWDIEFIKVDKDLPARTLQGAEFTLSGETLDETLTATSNEAGRITFEHLEAGTYLLKETKAPTAVDAEGKTLPEGETDDGSYTLNYALDETEHIVTVEEDGTYTIDGLEKNDKGIFVFPDERALNGQITVIKNWEDIDDSARTSPKVHLKTSEEYNTIKGFTVTVEWVGDYAAARPDTGALDITVTKNGEEYTGTCVFKSKGNIWTYYYPDLEFKATDEVKAYESEPVSSVEGAEYIGSAVGADNAATAAGGSVSITNTFSLKYEYGYTGSVQTFTAPADGWYQFEAWGAQGGGGMQNPRTSNPAATNATNGYGAYTSGKVKLNAGQTIYVYVGQGGQQCKDFNWNRRAPQTDQLLTEAAWNGGGRGTHDQNDDDGSGGGGGATDFRLTKDTTSGDGTSWNQSSSLASRIMVAAGGSGAAPADFYGSPGGTTESRLTRTYSSTTMILSVDQNGRTSEDTSNRQAVLGAGLDGYIATSRTSTNKAANTTTSNYPWNGMPGAGGGYYGGTVGHLLNGTASSSTSNGYAIGGVSYVSGYDGCTEYDGLTFTDPGMTAGDASLFTDLISNNLVERAYDDIRTTRGSKIVQAGYNGFARVTYVSEDSSTAPTPATPEQSGGEATDEYITDKEVDTEGGWVKVDDKTWKYVVNVFNDNAVYEVYEETIEGYTSEQYETFEHDGSKSKTVYVTNKAGASFGDLEVSKTVSGYTTAQKFAMTVTLTGDNIPEGTKVFDVTIGGTTNGVVFTNGVGTIKLADGETAVIKNIPIGTQYEVEEVANESFSAVYDGETGTISEETSEASVTNKYDTPVVQPANITIEKKVSGAVDEADADNEYPFVAMLTGLAPELEYTYTIGTESTTFTSDANGKATLSFNLKQDEKAVINKVPVGTGYQVTESAGDYISSYKLTDANSISEFAKTAGENTASNTALTTGEETVDQSSGDVEDVTVTFTNKLSGTQKLTVAKVVDKNGYDCPDTDEFQVTVKFDGLAPGAIISASNGKWKADDMGEVEKTVTLKDGTSVTFKDVPVGTKYTITEEKNVYVASYKITGDTEDPVNNKENFVKDSDTNDDGDPTTPSNNKKLSTAEETVNRYENATVTFTNKYEAVGTLETAEMAAKTVLHMQPECGEEGVTFDFTIEGEDEDTPMPADAEGAEVTAASVNMTEKGSKDIDFGTITYTRPNTYTYTIEEEDPRTSINSRWQEPVYVGFSDDHEVSVQVVDNHDGTLSATVLQCSIVNDFKTDLIITKYLDTFVDHDGDGKAAFVFVITGKDENGEVVYKNTAGIEFDGTSDYEETMIEDIPFDLDISVEEVDSLNYKHVGDYKDVKMVFDKTDLVFYADFENTADGDNIKPEGGIVNNYVKGEEGYEYIDPNIRPE